MLVFINYFEPDDPKTFQGENSLVKVLFFSSLNKSNVTMGYRDVYVYHNYFLE